jgi:hypothetical protein
MLAYVMAAAVAAGFTFAGAAKLARSRAMVARASHAGFSATTYQLIGAAEVAGALGVIAGLWFAPLGYAAGACLLLLMAGAFATHVRIGDKAVELIPAAVFALVTFAYLVALGTSR